MSKKYELTTETRLISNGIILHRIKALKDFDDIKKGDLGGWIESEKNLSQEGKCWIRTNACVYDYAMVQEDAQIFEHAQIFENALIRGEALIYGNAKVYGVATVFDRAQIYDNADVCGYTDVFGDAFIARNAHINGKSHSENLLIGGNMIFKTGMTTLSTDFVYVGPQGSRCSFATYHIPSNTICTGCFCGTLDEFEVVVEKRHKDNLKYLNQYKRLIKFFKSVKDDYVIQISQ